MIEDSEHDDSAEELAGYRQRGNNSSSMFRDHIEDIKREAQAENYSATFILTGALIVMLPAYPIILLVRGIGWLIAQLITRGENE